jgi:hypothetical protein
MFISAQAFTMQFVKELMDQRDKSTSAGTIFVILAASLIVSELPR